MFGASFYLKPLPTSTSDIQRVLAIDMLSHGYMDAPLSSRSSQVGPIFGQLALPSCPQNWEFWFTCGVKMMSLCHIWGWYLPQTTAYIHIGHIKSVWAINMMSQWHMGAPSCSCRYSSQVGPRFGKRASLVEWEWCHSVMVETNIQLILLHTFILDIYKVLVPLLCCLKGIWVHPYTIPSAKLSPELGILVHLGSKTDVINLCLRLNPPQTTVYIHIRHTQSV